MFEKDLSKKCVNSLLNSGADKAQVNISSYEKYELNVAAGDINLLRTMYDTKLNFEVINEGKKGSISLNKSDEDSINEAIKNVSVLCNTAEKDDANDISSKQPVKEFKVGDIEPNLDLMYERLNKFKDTVKEKYPKILFDAYFDFMHEHEEFSNSNGVDFKMSKGMYNFSAMFTAKDGEKSSSFNYTSFSKTNLDKELLDCGSLDILLKQCEQQTDMKNFEGKFEGDVIITPDCLRDIIYYYCATFLSDMALISGSSLLKDKLNEKVASEKLTIHSKPVSEEIADAYFVTPDGFEVQNMTIINKGTLKTFLLSLYGANKTKGQRAVDIGGAYVVEPGDKSFDELVKSIDKGILLCRFSGGNPSANGDISGVAKNSYYIENGEIKYPINETMISANLYKMFNNIKDISKERIDFGNAVLPWVCVSDVVISGK
jgi:PmbA protein